MKVSPLQYFIYCKSTSDLRQIVQDITNNITEDFEWKLPIRHNNCTTDGTQATKGNMIITKTAGTLTIVIGTDTEKRS